MKYLPKVVPDDHLLHTAHMFSWTPEYEVAVYRDYRVAVPQAIDPIDKSEPYCRLSQISSLASFHFGAAHPRKACWQCNKTCFGVPRNLSSRPTSQQEWVFCLKRICMKKQELQIKFNNAHIMIIGIEIFRFLVTVTTHLQGHFWLMWVKFELLVYQYVFIVMSWSHCRDLP